MNRLHKVGLLLAGLLAGIIIALSIASRSVPQNFTRSLSNVLVFEGGNDDDPRDSGGRTSRGIIQREYDKYRDRKGLPRRDVWQADQAEVVEIYREEYWKSPGVRGDDLPIGADFATMDYGVNSGVGRSGKVLRRVLRLPADDWRIDDAVLTAVRVRGPHAVIDLIVDEREAFLRSLRTCQYYCKGWLRRTASVRAIGHLMAGRPASLFAPQEIIPEFAPGKAFADEDDTP